MKKILVILALFFFTSPLAAQYIFWHQTNGPEAGTLENITIDSVGRVFIWTAGSGAFRSTDSGSSWQLFNRGLPSASLYIGAATSSGYLIAANAAASGQLFRSNENDPNAQWVEITPFSGAETVTINDIVADPADGKIYIAAGQHGVLRSDDNGATWLKKGVLLDTFSTHIGPDDNTLTLSIDGNGNLFAGLAATGAIFRSSDKGETWRKLPALFDSVYQKQLSSLLVAPNGNIIVGSIQSTLTIPGHIYVSTDTGRTWKSAYQRSTISEDQKSNIDKLIRVPNTNVIYANAHEPTLRSTDDGLSWTLMDTDKRGDEVFSMAARGNELFQMCEPDGIFLSTDNGANWTPKNRGIYAAYMYGVAVNSKQSVFAITEYGLWGSTDNGDSWDHKPEYGEDYHPSLFIDKKDSIFIGTQKGLFRSGNDGQTLTRVIIHIPDASINDSLKLNTVFQVGDDGHGKLFVASSVDSIGFIYSTNEGDHWTQIPKLPGQQQQKIFAFAFASVDTVFATSATLGGSNYYLSIDDGLTWRLLSNNSGLPAAQVLIAPSAAYLAREPGAEGGIFRSSDAQTWEKIFPPADFTGLLQDFYFMMIDQTGNIIVCTDSGVYRSKDPSYAEWYSVSEGLTANDVPGHFVKCAWVAENPFTHVFFAATRGLGVFKSVPGLGVSSQAKTPAASMNITTRPNPFINQANISFTLQSRKNVHLDVYDVLGKHIQSLLSGTFDQGDYTVSFNGSSLPSGNYLVSLHSGDESYATWVTLQR
jgi:photosystem II stability/assembly factor-like uncharacterized protein